MMKLILPILILLTIGCASQKKTVETVSYKDYSYPTLSNLTVGKCSYNRSDSSDMLLKSVSSCFKLGKYDKTDEISKLLLANYSNLPWGSYFQSVVAFERGNVELAKWMIEFNLKSHKSFPLAYYQKARIALLEKNYSLAVELLEKSVSFNNYIEDAHMLLGSIYITNVNYDKSLIHYSKVYDNNSKSKQATLGLAESYYYKDNLEKSLELYKKLDNNSSIKNKITLINKELTKRSISSVKKKEVQK